MNEAEKIGLADAILALAAKEADQRLAWADAVLKRIANERDHAFAVELASLYASDPEKAARRAQMPTPIADPTPRKVPDEVDGSFVFEFGKKHRGMRLADLVRLHPDYCHWLLTEATGFYENERWKPVRKWLEQELGLEPRYPMDDNPEEFGDIPF